VGYWPGMNVLKWLILSVAITKSLLLRLTGVCGMNKITVDLPPARFLCDSASRRPSLLPRSVCSSNRGMSKPPSPVKSVVHNQASIADVRWYTFATE